MPPARVSSFVDGIVVRTYPYRDSQVIVRLVAAGLGKISVLVRYGKSTRSRFGSTLDLFDTGAFELVSGRGSLLLLQSYQSQRIFRTLRDDLDKLASASVLCEAYDSLLIDAGHHLETSHSHTGYYERLISSIVKIDSGTSLPEVLRGLFFGLRDLLHVSGVLGSSHETPSIKNLNHLLDEVERHSEKQLESRQFIPAILARLANAATSPDQNEGNDREGQGKPPPFRSE